jgi:hypothetical protein
MLISALPFAVIVSAFKLPNFIKKAMKLTFFLQLKIPHSQTGLLDINKYVSAGGGFGPVSLIL